MVTVFWHEKGAALVNLLPRGTTVNCDHNSKTLRILNDHLYWVCPTRKMSEVLLLLDNARPHTSVCIVEAMTRFRWTVLVHPPYSPGCEDSITPVTRYCRMLCASGCRGGRATFGGWVCCSCSEVKEDSLQRWILHWKITVPSVML